MALVKIELKIPVEQDNVSEYISSAREKLALGENDIKLVKILRKSLDISDKEQFYYNIEISESVPDRIAEEKGLPVYTEQTNPANNVQNIRSAKHRPIIVGFGPAGMFAAPDEIAYTVKPHLGTDVLSEIVKNIREHIIGNGGEINYNSKITDILVENGKDSGVVINGVNERLADPVFLAVGHSARDTFEMLNKKGALMGQKPIAVGVRIEHPAEDINLMRYGAKYSNNRAIGAATYSFNHVERNSKRLVSTFCMCPGGEIMNASSENGLLVTNGMSYSKRDSVFSNSAVVVWCRAEDYGSAHPLAGIEFQKAIERKTFAAGGGNWQAPAQNLADFMEKRSSTGINKNSYKMGTSSVNLNAVLPDFVSAALLEAFSEWKKDYPIFVSDKAVLVGTETRTSCPVRIERNSQYESANIENLYPIGEGSGYTGGITSSAADAIRAVESCLASGSLR